MKVEGGTLRILDQNGAVRVLSPQQVTIRRENKNFAVAADSQGNDMRVGDAMKELDGEVGYGHDLADSSIAKERSSTFSDPSSSSCSTGRLRRTMVYSWLELKH
jgi:hypothetical protein